ncbi:MAG TPA: hypothetical protein VN743_03120 [Blastocatellia bacterium]|nr:hypothetical protein [Blastocatellia bacterium]
MKIRIGSVVLNPDHAIVNGSFETGDPKLPQHGVSFAISRDQVKQFEPGKVYPISFGDAEE